MLVEAGIEIEESKLDQVVRKLDRNGNGAVSYDELLTVMRVGPYGTPCRSVIFVVIS
jgi:Ca2+-binding EF-hand superfamily protein